VLLGLAPEQRALHGAALLLSLIGVAQQALLRLWSRREFQVPMDWWWLMGLGGLLVGAIGPTSTWRSLTGRGWTWKGRPLA
jgi:H+/Cl- antiporter ClcA